MIIGLDVGGTHTDVVLVDSQGLVRQVKVPTDIDNLFDSVLGGLDEVSKNIDVSRVSRVVLSTTLTTNAIASGHLDPVGMIVSSGPGLNPEIFRTGKHYYCVQGSIDHRGREVQPIEPTEIEAIASHLRADGIEAVGVVGKFSVRNPCHENKIVKILGKSFNYILAGHRVSGNLNFPRRIATVYLNAAVYSIYKNFFDAVSNALRAKGFVAPILILKADGGTVSLDASLQYPGQTILSGPAASIMGAVPYASENGESIVMDIGGTTTDIAVLVKQVPLLEPLGIEIGQYKTLIRALKTISIPLGGDSVIKVKDGVLDIGPERVGPAMAFGGSEPTPTDALVFLKKMESGDFQKAKMAMEKVGGLLGCSPADAAERIFSEFCHRLTVVAKDMVTSINQKPVYTVHEFLESYQVSPTELLVLGGPASCFASKLSEVSSLPVRVVPNARVANALGAALARTTCEITLFVDTERRVASAPEESFYKPVDDRFSVKDARELAFSLLRTKALQSGAKMEDIDMEVTEELQFNMVRGFYTTGRNIRVKVQVKPGLISEYKQITGTEA